VTHATPRFRQLPPPARPRGLFWRLVLFFAIFGGIGAAAGWWFIGPPETWDDFVRHLLRGEVIDTGLGHPLPKLGWSGWTMVASMALIVLLVLFLRGKNAGINVLQRCLVLSVLVHATISFALSFVFVTLQVSQYVKQETGVDLALSLPKSVELALSLRNPRSSEGPQAQAPGDLDPAMTMQEPHDSMSAPKSVPLNTSASGLGSSKSLMAPPLIMSVPAAAPPQGAAALAPIASPPDALTIKVPLPHRVSQQELQPSVLTPGPQVLVKSGLADPPSPQSANHGVTLQTGGETAADHMASIASPAPLLSPQIRGPEIGGGPSALSPVAAGPQINAPPAAAPKVSAAAPPVLLAGTEPGAGDDAVMGRLAQSGAGTAGVRFAPAKTGPRDVSGNVGDGPDAGPGAAAPSANGGGALAPAPIQIAKLNTDDLVAPNVPLIPPPPLIPQTERKMVAVTPFQRAPEQRKGRIAKLGGSAGSEEAVDHALQYLARQQEPDGRWTRVNDQSLPGKRAYNPHDMAFTGLALLTFLARDNSPFEPGPYQATVRRGLNYLLSNQSADGDLRGPAEFRGAASQQANMYDHAIAMLAISECALLSGDRRLASAARAGAQFIVNAQDQQGGGWRYAPGATGDSSVFGWEIMALHTAELLGFQIPANTRQSARHYIDNACSGPRNVLTSYQPGLDPTQTMTAEMIFARILLGERFSDAQVKDAGDFLSLYPPDAAHPDLYCWYYASLCMLQTNSPTWSDWNARTRDALIQLQTRGGFADGCWEIDAKGIDRSGYIFTTAIATLTLEVYYRYAPGLAEAPK
jgi:hypothetical protein